MKMRLSLATNILILVAIPFCLELAFVIVITRLQNEAEAEAKRARQERIISDRFNNISGDYYQAALYMSNLDMEKWLANKNIDSTYQKLLGKTRAQYAELLKLSENMPELSMSIRNSSKTLDEIDRIIGHAAQAAKAGRYSELMENYDAKTDRLKYLYKKLAGEQIAIVAQHEHLSAAASDETQSAIRRQVLQSAQTFGAGIGLFTMLLAAYLVRNVISRLKTVNDNVRKFAHHEPLNVSLAGNDEIAELDRAFHGMASSLEEAARQKQDMVNMLTHDLRSPLTAIRGTIEMIRERSTSLDDRDKQLVEVADRNSMRMMSLINDLLDIEKINSGLMSANIQSVCVAIAFEEVRASLNEWACLQEMKIMAEDTDVFVMADPEKLDRVMFNLVSNAIKFSPRGGTITLKAKAGEKDVEVSVIDQGKGISAKDLDSVFERFQQLDSDGKTGRGGSGLGLFICKSLITFMNGKIWATSKIGSGTTFHFTLPKG